jgi:hypothetical protein
VSTPTITRPDWQTVDVTAELSALRSDVAALTRLADRVEALTEHLNTEGK